MAKCTHRNVCFWAGTSKCRDCESYLKIITRKGKSVLVEDNLAVLLTSKQAWNRFWDQDTQIAVGRTSAAMLVFLKSAFFAGRESVNWAKKRSRKRVE